MLGHRPAWSAPSTGPSTAWPPHSCRPAPADLARGMHFPTGWDPYFRDYMTLADAYHYATQHYQHHRRQLTLAHVIEAGARPEVDATD